MKFKDRPKLEHFPKQKKPYSSIFVALKMCKNLVRTQESLSINSVKFIHPSPVAMYNEIAKLT